MDHRRIGSCRSSHQRWIVFALVCPPLLGSGGCALDVDDGGDVAVEAEAGLGARHRLVNRHQFFARRVREQASKHGVEPLEAAPDVRPELVELGRLLAFDKILSGNRDISCLTCHHPTLGTGDERSLPIGTAGSGLGMDRTHPTDVRIPRNAPALFNLHTFSLMFWDGRVSVDDEGDLITPAGDALTDEMKATFEFGVVSAQAMFPVTSRDEMRGQPGENELADIDDDDFESMWEALMERLSDVDEYVSLFEAAYPGTEFDEMTFAHAANAIAGFEVSVFESRDSPWQRFVEGDDDAMSTGELASAFVFFGSGCANCHSGSTLSDFSHRNTGLAQFGPGKGDGPSGTDDFGRFRETGDPSDMYAFRVPSLHNVELTAPYGHVGQFASLRRHVRHYRFPKWDLRRYRVEREVEDEAVHGSQVDNRQDVMAGIDPDVRKLNVLFVRPLVTFLEALTDESARDMSWVIPEAVPSGLPVED